MLKAELDLTKDEAEEKKPGLKIKLGGKALSQQPPAGPDDGAGQLKAKLSAAAAPAKKAAPKAKPKPSKEAGAKPGAKRKRKGADDEDNVRMLLRPAMHALLRAHGQLPLYTCTTGASAQCSQCGMPDVLRLCWCMCLHTVRSSHAPSAVQQWCTAAGGAERQGAVGGSFGLERKQLCLSRSGLLAT